MKKTQKNMKRILMYLLPAVSGLLIARSSFGLETDETSGEVGEFISTDEDIVLTLFVVLEWILGAAFAFAVGMIIVGGFRYITSAGNDGQAEAAKENITKAVIGLVIILLAFVIAATINTVLGSEGGSGGGGGGFGSNFGFRA